MGWEEAKTTNTTREGGFYPRDSNRGGDEQQQKSTSKENTKVEITRKGFTCRIGDQLSTSNSGVCEHKRDGEWSQRGTTKYRPNKSTGHGTGYRTDCSSSRSHFGNGDVNSGRYHTNVPKARHGNRVVKRRYQRFNSGLDRYTDGVSSVLSGTMGISKLTRVRKSLLKVSLIPFAVVTTTFLTGASNRAHAAVRDIKQLPTHKNNYESGNPGGWVPFPETFKRLDEMVSNFLDWVNELPGMIAEGSVHLTAWVYDLCASLILHTPLWIFNNEWFNNTTYLFSLISIGIVSVLTTVEGIKRMGSGLPKLGIGSKHNMRPMEFKDIMKRWFVVAGAMFSTPFVIQKAFQGLNWVSDFLISLGASSMKNLTYSASLSFLDVVTLAVFDIILISSIIPILWKNGRRFFDMLVLGAVTPLALTAWIFDGYRGHFTQWWRNFKHHGLVQVYYALFLLILGLFIFGVPTPGSFEGLLVKLLITVGGFARMSSPPAMISKHLDKGKGFDEVYAGVSQTRTHVKKNIADSAAILAKPSSIIPIAARRLAEKKVEGKTRMERYHKQQPATKAKPKRK